jgi:hypothetical protein
MKLQQFINQHGIKIDAEWADTNPHWTGEYPMNHWKCKLTNKYRKQMTVYFSTGLGLNGNPEAKDVLDCLAMDASCIENSRNFEDFANDIGYDPDSRKAEKIYKVILRQAEQLKKFLLGNDNYNTLLWDTERL